MPWTLLVDDEPNLCRVLLGLLEQAGHPARAVGGAAAALPLLADRELALVLTDLRMPGMDGLDLLSQIHRTRPEVPVILMTAFGTIETAVEAMKRGAHDFLVKPIDREDLLFCVRKALGASRSAKGIRACLADAEGRYRLIGSDPRMRALQGTLARVAQATTTVLVTGESGTGKELVARELHALGPRRDGPLIKVNCAALPETLLESELFGYERGAFTGAVRDKPGRFELAAGGTLFLDEIAELPLTTQAKLLRVLSDRQFERLGGVTTLRADARVVVATNRDLRGLVREGRFREDLFFRVNVVRVELPPLRERSGDLPALAGFFLERFGRENGRSGLFLAPETLAALCAHAWPGNVRELENALERAVVLADGPALLPSDLPTEVTASVAATVPVRPASARAASPPEAEPVPAAPAARGGGATLRSATEEAEKTAILRALEEAGGNRTHAARRLGVSRRTLQKKLKEYGLR
ncbi:MAG: sigma-54-dependent Fis family transcriptional regulator [Planctomycetes bacterium]|nr:sigma-54-dependent Fis family transcriptional regulator [Planctomycetota bacterium]